MDKADSIRHIASSKGIDFIQSARYIIFGSKALNRIIDILTLLGLRKKTGIIISGSTKTYKIGLDVQSKIDSEGFKAEIIPVKSGIPALKEVYRVEKAISLANAEYVIAVGGGSIIDIAKLSAAWRNLKYISVPTSAAHDGIASPSISFLLKQEVERTRGPEWSRCEAPIAIIADTEVIMNAPEVTLISGCGDLISKYVSVKDWILAAKLKDEPFSEYAASLALLSARLVASHAAEIKPGLEESVRIVVKSLIGSGMAISIAGSSRPASGSEHMFSHALDLLHKERGYRNAPHGIQCGLGAIMMEYLHGGNWKRLRRKLKIIGCPVTAVEAGLSEEAVVKALTIAHKIRNRYTILGESGLSENAARKLAMKTGVIEGD